MLKKRARDVAIASALMTGLVAAAPGCSNEVISTALLGSKYVDDED